jgi:hypothetical protein
MGVSIKENLRAHSVLLLVFFLVVLGVITWKLTTPSEGFLDAGLAEIRAQVLASEYKHKSPQTCATGLCPLSTASSVGSSGVAPCFLGLKDQTPGQKPLSELAPVLPRQFPKCLRCEDVINRSISIIPANGAFVLGHYLAKKKDNNSIVIIPELVANSAVRRATDGHFRLLLGLADPIGGVSIYHPETDQVIARDAEGRAALAPINNFTGDLAPAATFELVDGPTNYSTVAFKCKPIGRELTNEDKYLGFVQGATPGGHPLIVLSSIGSIPSGTTYEFDLVDIETGIPVIMNKHSGKNCQQPLVEGFWDGIATNSDTDSNFETRDKRKVRGLSLAGELGHLELSQKETNNDIPGIQKEIQRMKPTNLAQLMNGLPPMPENVKELALTLNVAELSNITDRPFTTEAFADTTTNLAINSVGMLPITLDELGKVPDNLFKPAAGLAFNNSLNVQNQVYKDQLTDKVFQKMNAAKLSPSVQNILDYNSTAYQIYERENRDFGDKIDKQTRTNGDKLDDMIANLDKQRVQSMSRDLFFLQNQFAKANARPLSKN